MATQIINQIVLIQTDQDRVVFSIIDNKKEIIVSNESTDATCFSFKISKENWDEISKFIDSKLI